MTPRWISAAQRRVYFFFKFILSMCRICACLVRGIFVSNRHWDFHGRLLKMKRITEMCLCKKGNRKDRNMCYNWLVWCQQYVAHECWYHLALMACHVGLWVYSDLCRPVNRQQFTTPSFQKITALALNAPTSLDTHFVSAFHKNYFWYVSSKVGSAVYVILRPCNLDMVARHTVQRIIWSFCRRV